MIPKSKKERKNFSITDLSELNIKKEANNQERKIAKAIGGINTIKSGGYIFDPADIRLEDSIVEVKNALKSKQIIIKEEMLGKLLKESNRVGKNPIMILNFPYSNLRIKKWIIIPYE